MTWILHPRFRQLGRLADGQCDPAEERRLREHLADCERCRRELAFIRELGRAVEEIPAPRPPEDGFSEILARRDAGERRILPLRDPSPPARTPRVLGLLGLAAGLLAAASAAVFFLTGQAAAGASQLRLSPDALPAAAGMAAEGAAAGMAVEYRTASALAGEERLRLRARYRESEDPWPRDLEGRPLESELARIGAGRFGGDLQLPESAVYAAFSVEDLAGRHVDANGGRFWEVMARDGEGRPTFEALVQRIRVLEIVRWAEALETARRATELHPDRIQGWFLRFFYEGLVLDRERRDSLVAYHRDRFTEFERQVAGRGDPSAEDLAALVHYARTLGDREAVERWAARLEAVQPTHRVAVQERLIAAGRSLAGDPGAYLDALEEEWKRSGPAEESLLDAGFRTAVRLGDAERILQWGQRIERYAPHRASRIATEIAAIPELRREGMARLRGELLRLERMDPDFRPLDRGVDEHQEATGRRAAWLLTSLGRALTAEGETEAALDTLELAGRTSWDPELFRELAELRLAIHDTAGAVRLMAFAAADPLTPAAGPGSGPEGFAPGLDEAAWERLVAEGRAELRRRMLERAELRRIPPGVRVVDGTGADGDLKELLNPGPTLLFYWSPRSHPAVQALARLEEASARLAEAGVRVVTVAEGPPGPDARPGGGATDLPVFFDAHGEVNDALELWLTRRFVILDEAGRVRFRERDPEEALRRALVLAAE